MIPRLLTVLLAGFLWLTAASASATILFAGGEDVDFICSGACGVRGSILEYRAAYARLGTSLNAANNDPPGGFFLTQPFTPSGTVWVHAFLWESRDNQTFTNGQFVAVYGSDGNPAIIVRGTGVSGQVKISTRNTSGTLTDLVTCPATVWPVNNASTVNQFDMQLVYAVAGSVTLYNNSVSFCTFSGDVTTNSRTQVNQARFSSGNASGEITTWSEVIIADSDTRAMSLVTMEPAAAGTATAWTGVNPCTAIVNTGIINDANFISTTSSNVLNQCTIKFGNGNTTFPLGSYSVPAVVSSFRGLRGATGPQHIEHNLRTGGVDSNSSDVTLTTSFANYQNYWVTNPNGGGSWATSDLTAVGFNIGVKATP